MSPQAEYHFRCRGVTYSYDLCRLVITAGPGQLRNEYQKYTIIEIPESIKVWFSHKKGLKVLGTEDSPF